MNTSVTIATFNRAEMVMEAISAALAQTPPPAEIVVADDASTDDTWQTLQALAHKHPALRIYRREHNSGGVDNWNFAIRQSTGDYIAWCSDDDRFMEGHLESSIEYLQRHPEVGLVYSGFADAIENEQQTRIEARPLRFSVPHRLDRKRLPAYLVRYYDWPFHPSTIVMRRRVWNQIGPFDPGYALADTDWFVRTVEQFTVVMLPRRGVLNRRHAGNWSNRLGSAQMQREIFCIVDQCLQRIFSRSPLRLRFWRALWRINVRARLLLTIKARLRTGHGVAAGAAWETLTGHTGTHFPGLLTRCGLGLIHWWCARHPAERNNARQSTSPL